MSKSRPIWGIDVAHWQQLIDMRRVKHEGYDFVVAKATEGPSRDGSKYTDDRYRQHMRNAQAADLIVGVYHFLVEDPGEAPGGSFPQHRGRRARQDHHGGLRALQPPMGS